MSKLTMDDLLAKYDVKPLKVGDVMDATVLSVKKHEAWMDMGPYGVGVVLRKEIGYGQALELGRC